MRPKPYFARTLTRTLGAKEVVTAAKDLRVIAAQHPAHAATLTPHAEQVSARRAAATVATDRPSAVIVSRKHKADAQGW